MSDFSIESHDLSQDGSPAEPTPEVPAEAKIEALAAARRKLYTAAEIGRGKILQPPPLFEDFLLDKTITMVSGPPGSRKTFMLLDMMICLEFGLPLWNKFIPAGTRSSLYLGQDSADWDVAKQFRKLARGHGLSREDTDAMDSYFLLNEQLNILEPSTIKWIKDWVRATGARLVILETLVRWHHLNENDSGEMSRVMARLEEIRDLGVAVIFAHHLSKPQIANVRDPIFDSRGSTAITGSVDFEVRTTIMRPLTWFGKDVPPSAKPYRTVITMPKGRADFSWNSFRLTWTSTDTPTGPTMVAVYEDPVEPGSRSQYKPILEFITQNIRDRQAMISKLRATDRWKGAEVSSISRYVDNGLRYYMRRDLIRKAPSGAWEIVE